MKTYLLLIILTVILPWYGFGGNLSASFESYDFPGWYIGVQNEEAILMRLDSEINKEYTTFNLVSGFADENHLSLQSAVDMNYYLRRENRDVMLHENSTWMMYKENATFQVVPGLADIHNPNCITIKSWRYPAKVVHHKYGKIFMEESDGSEVFKKSATFIIKPPNWNGTPRLSHQRTGENSFTRSREASIAGFIFYIALIMFIPIIIVINLPGHMKSRRDNKELIKMYRHYEKMWN